MKIFSLFLVLLSFMVSSAYTFVTVEDNPSMTVQAVLLDKSKEERHHKSRHYTSYDGYFRMVDKPNTLMKRNISQFVYEKEPLGSVFDLKLRQSTIEEWTFGDYVRHSMVKLACMAVFFISLLVTVLYSKFLLDEHDKAKAV